MVHIRSLYDHFMRCPRFQYIYLEGASRALHEDAFASLDITQPPIRRTKQRSVTSRALSGLYTQRNLFRNPIESNRNQIVFTIFRLIWNQMDVRLIQNQSENV